MWKPRINTDYVSLALKSIAFALHPRASMVQTAEMFMKFAIKLLRLHNETIEALNRHRRKGEQKVVVQHVNVENGGKAIVGNLIAGEGQKIK